MDGLTVGAELLESFGFDSVRIVKVVRVTATQAITDKGTRYRLADGRKIGGFGWAALATDAHRERIQRDRMECEVIRRAESRTFRQAVREATTETLREWLAVLPPVTEEPR